MKNNEIEMFNWLKNGLNNINEYGSCPITSQKRVYVLEDG